MYLDPNYISRCIVKSMYINLSKRPITGGVHTFDGDRINIQIKSNYYTSMMILFETNY